MGATQQPPENERYILTESYLKDRMTVMLAGRMAEKEFSGSYSSGADDDISQATHIARSMVTRWGMSKDIGPVDLRESDEHPFLGREITKSILHGDSSAGKIDQAIKELLTQAQENARQIIIQNKQKIMQLVAVLMEKRVSDKRRNYQYIRRKRCR